MDFVRLNYTKVNSMIWMIVDRLTKCAHFLAIKMIDILSRLSHPYVREINYLHSVPLSFVFDKDLGFVYRLWVSL